MAAEEFDPLEKVMEVKYPCPTNVNGRSVRMPFITLWHIDPAAAGHDDSCYESMRVFYGKKSEVVGYPELMDRVWWFNKVFAWRLHFWHWRLQIHPIQKFKRWLSSRCDYCGEGFEWGEVPVTTNPDPFQENAPGWLWSEEDIYHPECFSEYYGEEKYGSQWGELQSELNEVREKRE